MPSSKNFRSTIYHQAKSQGLPVKWSMKTAEMQQVMANNIRQNAAARSLQSFGRIIKDKTSKFLSNPVDGDVIHTNATTLLKHINEIKMTNGYFIRMGFTGTDNSNNKIEEYKVMSNLDDIKDALNKIKAGYTFTASQDIAGSDTDFIIDAIKYNRDIELMWQSTETSGYNKRSGAYFKWFNLTKLPLTRYQIFRKGQDSQRLDKESCFMFALKMSKKVPTADIDNLKLSLFNKEIKVSDFKKIAQQLNITLKLKTYHRGDKSYNIGKDVVIEIGLVDGHFFLCEPTKITKYAIDNYEKVKSDPNFPTVHNPKSHKKMKLLDSFTVVNTLYTRYSSTLLEPISWENIGNRETIEEVHEYDNLLPPMPHCGCEKNIQHIDRMGAAEYLKFKKCQCKKTSHEFRHYGDLTNSQPFRGFFKSTDPNEKYDLWFVDTETFISKEHGYHIPYCLCAIKKKDDKFISYKFYGLNCVEQFILKCLTNHSIIYCHNLAFDFRMFIEKKTFSSNHTPIYFEEYQTPIETGTKLKQIQCKLNRGTKFDYNSQSHYPYIKHILFKDSYAFLPNRLADLPAMFGLQCGDKEVYPYTLINATNFDKHVPLSECRQHIKVGLRKAFSENAKRIGAFDVKTKMVDMKKYTIHYCMQDTSILAHAFSKFREQIQEVCDMDIISLVSLPQLADRYLKSKGVYDGCYAFSGIAQDFIRRCCVGGRCMSNSNQKFKLSGEALSDFDAVSLYPSAMAAMKGYLKGFPRVIQEYEIDDWKQFKTEVDAYFVEIEVLSHTTDREFPLQSVKTPEGIRNFTNDIDGKRFYVDNIALDDFVKYQGVEYRVLRGYFFKSGFNTKINEVIHFMFNERLRLKKEGNPLQLVYKLLMNASYGKLIQKPIKTTKKLITGENIKKYVIRNHKFIDSYTKVSDNLYAVKERKSIITHMTACHIACQILSTSKRLMNQVMATAEDMGIKIYYQDTDSMHIPENAIPALAKVFKERHGHELIGKAMGQFHSDFEVSDKNAKDVKAVETIILGKKCYIDKLQYKNGANHTKYAYHIRMKGVPSQSVRDFDSDYMRTYERLFDGEEIEFDLSAYCPLQIDKDYRARANTKCISRKLKF